MSERAQGHGWLERLAARWKVPVGRVLVILLVFALTGTTVMLLKRPVVAWVAGDQGEQPLLFTIAYYVLILPIYNLLLLIYGTVFGQFRFFWGFEKRFFRRIFDRGRRSGDQ